MTKATNKILIVDDEQDFREVLKIVFKKENWYVEEAFDGIDALTNLKFNQYDVILSDVNMPNLNGLELLTEVRLSEQNRTTPVILMSGIYTQKEVENMAGYRISKMIPKPFTYDDFKKSYFGLMDNKNEVSKMNFKESMNFEDTLVDIDIDSKKNKTKKS